jgi:HlyD family secretion protein
MPHVLRRLSVAAAILGIGGAAVWALWPKPISVDLATITRGPIEVTVEDEGVTRIRDIYTISAPIPGKLHRSALKIGDTVAAEKTVVAVLEPAEPPLLDVRSQRSSEAAIEAARAAVDLAEAQVSQSKAELGFAQSDLKRARQLAIKGTIPERTLDQSTLTAATAQAALATAKANLDLRKHELESAEAQMIRPGEPLVTGSSCCIDVRSPVTGVVLTVPVESEQVVQAGQPLLSVGDPANIEVTAELLSRDAVRVEVGDLVSIDNWGGEAPLAARVTRLDPTGRTKVSALGIEEQRVTAVFQLTSPREQWQRLGHGFRVVVRIVVWRNENALVVPLGALFRNGEDWSVYLAVNGVATLRPIKIGQRNLHDAEVLSGLQQDDQVILHPTDLLTDGARIK